MRCYKCQYVQHYMGEGVEEDSCTLCWLTNEDEQTENRKGELGCLFNQRTLDKRHKELEESLKNGMYF